MLGERRVAGFWPRLGAGLVDWLVVFAVLWLGVIAGALLEPDGGDPQLALSYGTLLVLPLLYFGLTWARSGQTLGLRATDLRLVSTSTMEPPSRARALLRALVGVLTFAACWFALVTGFGDEVGSTAVAVGGVALAFALLAFVGHLWALVDRRGQSLQDRLFGLAVLADGTNRSYSGAETSRRSTSGR
jgi:uncharacterized RDD family membrane protein YckC